MAGNGKVGLMNAVFEKSRWLGFALLAAAGAASAHAAEHVTLTNGFDLICDHRAQVSTPVGGRVRLYMDAGSSNFIDVEPSQIATSELITAPPTTVVVDPVSAKVETELTPAEIGEMLAKAGAEHDLDADLLASVVREESGGHANAVSRAGAQGLMQLMPGTATELGVGDAFAPGDNIRGGTEYLDGLLKRYHDNLALALAAYNAGPGAVDRWHGIPPYRETRLYVARVIHEFNRRIAARKAHGLTQVAAAR